jgi:hypothetical protein
VTIKKTKQGYEVVSEKTGRKLSKSNLSKGEAQKRLEQVDYFKNKKKK